MYRVERKCMAQHAKLGCNGDQEEPIQQRKHCNAQLCTWESPQKINHWKIRNCIGKCALGYILLVHQNLYLNFASSERREIVKKQGFRFYTMKPCKFLILKQICLKLQNSTIPSSRGRFPYIIFPYNKQDIVQYHQD